ncbi:MAG: thiamine biosynthesis protein ThiS [Bacteroidales bacterium 45-6]|nr:MAG: thiamine biosynthesis protein ThiS [Bacteroidales bacterium 45-6]
MSKIKVNDELQEVTLPLTVTGLIQLNNVLQPDMVSVQLNGEFVERGEFDATELKEGDEVDFLYFMGGGC